MSSLSHALHNLRLQRLSCWPLSIIKFHGDSCASPCRGVFRAAAFLEAAARKACRVFRLQSVPMHVGLHDAQGSGVTVRLQAQHREIEISLASQVFSESLARNALAAGSAQRLRNTA